jgi:hypothetical protein
MDDMLTEIFGPVIHGHSREKALRDGELVNAGDLAYEVTRQFPIALTRAAHIAAVEWSPEHGDHQSEEARLRDVLIVARGAMLRNPRESRAEFSLYRMENTPKASQTTLLALSVVLGPGDDGNPVITIMLPEED